MKPTRPLASRLGLALAAAAAVMSLSTCDDFFGTEDLKEQIQEDVALANAESVSFTINAAPSSGGTLSMSGVQTKKVGENFSITATVFDNYVFGGWTSSGGGEVTFAYPNEADETTTVAKIGAASDDVVITANFVARPYVKTVTPSEGNTVVKNQPIIANFSKAMDPDSFSLPGRVTVTYDGINPTTANPRTIYASGSSSSYFTIGITSTRLTLTPTGSFMPANSTITVLISSDVTDADGTTMAESKEWYFYTNNDTDTSAPEIDGITIRNGNSSAAVARTFTSGDTYHAVKSRSVTVEIAAHTISASSTVQSMVLIESGYSGGVSTSRTTELGYTDSYAYTLATTDDGPKALTYYVKSSTGIESAHESINLYLDSAPPTLSFGTITSNNTTNPAYARESSVVSLAFTAADASGSGIYSTTASVAGQDASVSGSTATLTVAAGTTDGLVSYSMTVTDYAGNSVTGSAGATGSVTVDRTPPTVNVASAGNKTVGRNGETISFTATFADANGIDETTAPAIVIGGISHTMAKSTNLVWTYDYPVPTGDSAPSFVVTIDATDVAGNDNTAATGVQSVIVDNTKPTISAGAITITGVTANAGYAREGSVVRIPLTISESSTGVTTKPTVKLTDVDGVEIATMAVTDPVGTAPTYTCEATYTMTASNAEVLLHYTISGTTDGAGNVMTAIGPATTGRTYDRTLPTASYIYLGSDTSPGATYTTTGKPAVYSDAADANALFAQFSYDGTTWTPLETFASGTTAVDLTSGSQGSRQVRMRLFDAAGNQKVDPVQDSITYDSGKPTAAVSSISPTSGVNNGGTITFTVTLTEETSGIQTAPTVSITNGTSSRDATVTPGAPSGTLYPYSVSYSVPAEEATWASGNALSYTITSAMDNAGNVMDAV
ncbi:MAG TPA: hypothetical protein P5298_12960, partial [Spirochaetia bacterium]|nr:hypothetical protein [Spirochaetia bacterium]